MSNELNFEQILDLCPKSVNFYKNSNGPDLQVVSRLLREFNHLHKLVKAEKVAKNEIFLFVNQDFLMSINKYVRYYNSELSRDYPIGFLPETYNEDDYLGAGRRFALICAPAIHINYFKLTAETHRQQIFRIEDSLKEEMPENNGMFEIEWWNKQICSKPFTKQYE